MKNNISVVALAIVALASCNMNVPDVGKTGDDDLFTIYASVEHDQEVRNIIDNASFKTTWLAGDAINVFFGASESSRFVTNESGEVAQFKGSIDVVTGGGEGLTDETSLWGIYPYDSRNTCDGSYVTLTLPSNQKAAENVSSPDISAERQSSAPIGKLNISQINNTLLNPDSHNNEYCSLPETISYNNEYSTLPEKLHFLTDYQFSLEHMV